MTRLILILSIALAACAGTPFKWESARKIQPGMTTGEVTALLGPPYSARSQGENLIYVWAYADAFAGSKSLAIEFRDNKVVKAPPIPDAY